MSLGRVLILGGGPTGLAAAHRLRQAGHDDFLVLERESQVGGLSVTQQDAVGFAWDVGSHVFFSADPGYDAWLNQWMPESEWLTHQRNAKVWLDGRFWPYPIQQHAVALQCEPVGDRLPVPDGPVPFGWWLTNEYGDGLAKRFFTPYNEKVWGYPLAMMDAKPITDRLAPAGGAPSAWGPNATFRYPRRGAGDVWARAAAHLGLRVLTHTTVIGLDPVDRLVAIRRGNGSFSEYRYDHLISTLPLTEVVALCGQSTDRAKASAFSLRHSGLFTVGLGFEGTPPPDLAGVSWWYDSSPETPYYRGSVLSSYSPAMTPPGCWSLMLEVCESSYRPVVNPFTLIDHCLDSLRRQGFYYKPPIARWQRYRRYGYPTPTLDRQHWLDTLRAELDACGIVSVGRFGAWQYERGNMDHCVRQGQEAANRLLERAS